jgi:uncharacterized membrane protein
LFEILFKYTREDYARGELVFLGDLPTPVLSLFGAVIIIAITLLLYRRRNDARVVQLVSVWLLQIAMLAVVVWMILQPALQTEQLKPGENSVAIVADNSESMSYGDTKTRLAEALELLSDSSSDATLDITPSLYALSDEASPLDTFNELQPVGSATSIADSLITILSDARSESLAAVVLGSDGIDTAGGISADKLAEIAAFGVPIHTIGVGRDAIAEDLELSQVLLPERALPASTVSARVSIRHDRSGEARVKIYDGDELLATEPVALQANTTTTTAWIDIELREAGHHRLQVSVESESEEPERRNNQRAALVKVEDQQFRILYFEGEPRWEYKFLRRALETEEDIKLVSLLRVSPNKFYRQGLESPQQLENGFPTTRSELFAYDALIIGSVEAASFSAEQLDIVRAFVSERGGSLLMLAGPNGLGNGGWGQSSIADLLPARLPNSQVDSFVRSKAAVVLTPQGADTQMLRLAYTAEANEAAWRELPEIADYQSTGELKPAAMTLLSASTDDGTMPLLMTQPFGRGHAYILASGGTWRWQMSMPLEDQSHESFWRQFMRALVASAPTNVSLSASAAAGESAIRLRAEFRDDAFNPIDDLRVSAVVSHEDGESWTVDLLPSADESGVFAADTVLNKSGAWYFEAIAERNGEVFDIVRSSVFSESGQAEYFNIRRNSALLRRLSESTGGQYFEAGEIDALPDLLRYSNAGITEQIHRPIWDALAVFLLLLILKTGEWLLRRRWSTI